MHALPKTCDTLQTLKNDEKYENLMKSQVAGVSFA
jgi:hypothetical protein